MIKSLALYIFIKFYQIYNIIWNLIFSFLGKIMMIYHLEKDELNNITLHYYFDMIPKKFETGIYYIKFIDSNGTNHIAYQGNINQIKDISLHDPSENPPKRKNIALVNHDQFSYSDLHLLDNYKMNIPKSPFVPVTNLSKIMIFLGIKCSHIKIIEIIPFSNKIVKIDDLDINSLYYDQNKVPLATEYMVN